MDWKLEADRAEKILDNEASDEGYYNESREVAWGLLQTVRALGVERDVYQAKARRYVEELEVAYTQIQFLKDQNDHLISMLAGSKGE